MEIILASASPRRERLLREMGLRFRVVVAAGVVEELTGAVPAVLAVENARRKAVAVAGQHPQALVIGADTIVVCDGEIFGKPGDEADATVMLRKLAGRPHEVFTGVCLVHPAQPAPVTFAERTLVWMRRLTPAEIREYLATTRPYDKAGAYAIQEPGLNLVEKIDGSYRNVMGLPTERLRKVLTELGAV